MTALTKAEIEALPNYSVVNVFSKAPSGVIKSRYTACKALGGRYPWFTSGHSVEDVDGLLRWDAEVTLVASPVLDAVPRYRDHDRAS